MTASTPTATPTNRRVVLVTGGSRGLGRSASIALAERGMDVIFTYHRNEAAAADVVREIARRGGRAAALQLDTGDTDRFERFAAQVDERLGRDGFAPRLHGLVNNAGEALHATMAETTPAQFDRAVAVHVKGPFFLTQALLPLMADGGRILNVSSGLARFTLPGFGAYAMMKGAVEVMSRYQARELGPRGIVANTLAPGAIETDFGGGVVRDDRGLNAFVASQTALGRAGRTEDIGPLVAALMDDAHGWVNGQRIEASGGMFL